MNEKEGEKGFRVVDRRHFSAEGEALGKEVEGEPEKDKTKTAEDAPPAAGVSAAEEPNAASPPRAAGAAASVSASGEPQKKSLKERIFGKKKGDEGEAQAPDLPPGEDDLPDIDFANFLLSLVTSAYIHLGEAPDPITMKREKSLPLAKQTIDLLSLLAEKTKGNLTPDESRLLEGALYDLRLRYVQLGR